MADLSDLLAELGRPRLLWISATVSAVDPSGNVTLSYSGGTITKASRLASYTPVVGDRVEALSFEPMGVLVLGKNTAPAVVPPTFQSRAAVIVNPVTRGTYGPGVNEWTAGVLEQASGRVACVFFNGGFGALAGVALQSVEIEMVISTGGGPPDFVGIQNEGAAGILSTTGVPFRSVNNSPGAAVWMPLPIGIGQALVSGAIKGIGITSNGQSGSYTGSGRVRLTPLSVTI